MKLKKKVSKSEFRRKLKKIKKNKQESDMDSEKKSNSICVNNENDFSFMESIEKLLVKNKKMKSDSLNSLPDISTDYWSKLIKNKQDLIQTKIQKYFNSIKQSKIQNLKHIKRGRLMLPSELKVKNCKKIIIENPKTPKNFSSKKIQLRISKSNNINKKHINNSFENSKNVDCSVLESHRKKHFKSSKKKKSDKRERMKSELPNINLRVSKIEKQFSRKYANCIPFPEKMYKMLGVLGKGSYGIVFLAVHLISGQKVAIKAIKKNRNNEMPRNYKKIINEIDIFSSLRNKNIISLYEVFENRKYIFLVTEYAEKGKVF